MKFQSIVFLMIIALFGCNQNNVKSDTTIATVFSKYNVKGSFALLENGTGDFVIQDLNFYKDSAQSPLQTFFIVPELIGINNGIITHNESISLDAIDSNLKVANLVGAAAIKKVLDSLHYGNKVDSISIDHSWKDGSLRITMDEQLGFIKRLYFNKLPFEKKSQEWMKKQILKESNSNYSLSYINGAFENKAWMLGFIEENKHPYFFVLYFNSTSAPTTINNNVSILKELLEKQGFFKGLR